MKIRRWIWLCLWIVSMVCITFYGGALSYGFFYAVTMIPVVSWIYLVFVYLRFKIYQKVEGRVLVSGQPVPYAFTLQNEDYFAFTGVSVRLFSDFSYVDRLPEDKEYQLLPGDSIDYETQLTCRYRGEYQVGIKEIIVTDLFRLFSLHYRNPGAVTVQVYPRIIQLETINSLEQIAVSLQRESNRTQAEPEVSVRDYMDGDALNQIHWKATAREQKLKVRQKAGEEKQGVFLFCDTKRYSMKQAVFLPLENKLLEVVLALGMHLAKNNIVYTAYTADWNQRVEGLRTYDDWYQRAAELTFREDEEPLERLAALWRQGEMVSCRIFFLVLHTVNDAVLEFTEQIADSGCTVIIYLVTEENTESFVRQSVPNRTIIEVPLEGELEGVL